MREQITYDKKAERAYMHLTDFEAGSVATTVDLMENQEIIIHFGWQVPVIGVELAGRTAQKVKYLNGTADVFVREVIAQGFKHSFRLSNEKAAGSAVHPDAPHVVFLFSDESCNEFLGIDLYEIGGTKRVWR
ncbi:hypothetical protein RG959_18050 [Domibacillus sp. 8LH]|uniref:hypothetical protein n=1 Tax=Domibacillus sp. 8LH TaxID=3073900 RepID=UPI0031746C3F